MELKEAFYVSHFCESVIIVYSQLTKCCTVDFAICAAISCDKTDCVD